MKYGTHYRQHQVERRGLTLKTQLISNHVFFFPFTWKIASDQKSLYVKQHKQMKKGLRVPIETWRERNYEILEDSHYNELVYFYRPVQAVLYENDHSCIVYSYEKEQRGEEDWVMLQVDGMQYELSLEEISLKLYKSGVGIMTFQMGNTKHQQPEHIIAINAIGKCVYPYLLPLEKVQKDFFPERIEIHVGENTIVERFSKKYKEEPMIVADFLMELMGPSFTCCTGSVGKNMFYIEPLFSNRMFTLCMYQNREFLQAIKDKSVKDQFLTQFMVFSRREKVLDISYIQLPKVVYGIGRFSMIGIAMGQEESCLYNQLVTLAIVQRATLLHFSNQLAFISALPKAKLVVGIGNLYEIYVQFINQMYFNEVTVDVQGTSIYNALFKQFGIREEMKELDFEMREVHEYSSLIQKQQSQIRMDLLTIVGSILVIPTFVTGFFGMNILEDRFMKWWVHKDVGLFLNSYVALPVLSVLLVYSWCTRNHRYYKIWGIILVICLVISLSILLTQGCGLAS